jgi:hypothetical protein
MAAVTKTAGIGLPRRFYERCLGRNRGTAAGDCLGEDRIRMWPGPRVTLTPEACFLEAILVLATSTTSRLLEAYGLDRACLLARLGNLMGPAEKTAVRLIQAPPL